jgi:uncharacterized membrane-anchored protein
MVASTFVSFVKVMFTALKRLYLPKNVNNIRSQVYLAMRAYLEKQLCIQLVNNTTR